MLDRVYATAPQGRRFRAPLALVLIGTGVLLSPTADACTTFMMGSGKQLFVGKSYDWHTGSGVVLTNKRGVQKSSLVLSAAETPANWTSRFASLTFNQHGREFPVSGMNEAGLVVEVMWLSSSQYPASDGRPVLNELQWVQYVLDNFATVAELALKARELRVAPVHASVHYLVCDKSAACAALEYLDGRLVISSESAMPAKSLTNDTYATSAAYLRGYVGFGGAQAIPSSDLGSLSRFVRASAMALDSAKTKSVDYAFSILDSVSSGSFSVWNLVYVPHEQKVYFRTYASTTIKQVTLSAFAPGCTAPVKALDIDSAAGGDTTARFRDYSDADNRAYVERGFQSIGVSTSLLEQVASYPQNLRCVTGEPSPDGGRGRADGGGPEAGPRPDSGPTPDVGAARDAQRPPDLAAHPDATAGRDAHTQRDLRVRDAGGPEAGAADAGPREAGATDGARSSADAAPAGKGASGGCSVAIPLDSPLEAAPWLCALGALLLFGWRRSRRLS